jgi:hypothetical protein
MTESVVSNLGPRERRKRFVLGIAALVAGAGLAFMLVAWDAPRWSRLLIFLPVWVAALGLFQARERTCIALAARGARNMDQGEEAIDDAEQAAELRRVARRIHRRALLTAIIVTMVALAFPG